MISVWSVVCGRNGDSGWPVRIPAGNVSRMSCSWLECHWLLIDVVYKTRLFFQTNRQLGELGAVSATCVLATELLGCLGRHSAWTLAKRELGLGLCVLDSMIQIQLDCSKLFRFLSQKMRSDAKHVSICICSMIYIIFLRSCIENELFSK